MPSKTWNLRQINVGATNPNRLWWDEAPAAAAATSVTGWNVRQIGANNYGALVQGAEINNFSTTIVPNATAPVVDNSYAATAIYTPPTLLNDTESISTLYEYNGVFPAGNWVFAFPVIAVSTANTLQDGAITMRVFKGVRSGTAWASVTELTSAMLQGTTVTDLTSSLAQTSTVTWNAPAFRLNNEFLICKIGWRIIGAANNNNADVVLRWGTGATMTSTNFKKRSYNTT